MLVEVFTSSIEDSESSADSPIVGFGIGVLVGSGVVTAEDVGVFLGVSVFVGVLVGVSVYSGVGVGVSVGVGSGVAVLGANGMQLSGRGDSKSVGL